jgi:hypothetical protein
LAIAGALLALLILGPAPAGAGQITRRELSDDCNWSGEQFAAAFACDPAAGKSAITLTLGDERYTDRRGEGLASLGAEPLLPGETVKLDWPHPSRKAELDINAASSIGTREAVIALTWRPTHVEVSARPDGSLELHTAAINAVIPPPTPLPTIDWQPRSAREAAARLLQATDHIEGSNVSSEILCAALDPAVLPAFGVPPTPFPDPFHSNAPDPCLDPMGTAILGDYNDSLTPTGTRHRGLSVRVRGNSAIFATTLSHRYSDYGVARRREGHARGLLTRDSQGIWRLATLEPLLPLTLLRHPQPFSDAELAATYRRDRHHGADAQGRFNREFQAIRSATVTAGTAAPCSVAMIDDDLGDQSWSLDGQQLDAYPRHPEEHTDVDLTAAGSSSRCLALRTAAPLPARFYLNLDNHFEIDVANGKVVLFADAGDTNVPVRGISASIDGTQFVMRVPVDLSRVTGVELFADSFVDLAYGDFAFTLP